MFLVRKPNLRIFIFVNVSWNVNPTRFHIPNDISGELGQVWLNSCWRDAQIQNTFCEYGKDFLAMKTT